MELGTVSTGHSKGRLDLGMRDFGGGCTSAGAGAE